MFGIEDFQQGDKINHDVHGSVHQSTTHEEKSNKCNNVSKLYYFLFIWSSKCFGRLTAHHQEPKTALAASGFSYVEGCWTCGWWTLSGTVCLTRHDIRTSLRVQVTISIYEHHIAPYSAAGYSNITRLFWPWPAPSFFIVAFQPLKPRIKSHLLFAGIIRSSPFSPR